MSSSPADDAGGEPVELFLMGRTLRGTLGEAFRADAVARFETLHPGATDAPEPHSAIGRTVELTAVAVTRAGPVRVDVAIADPAFRSAAASASASAPAEPGETVFELAVDEVAGISPLVGPPGTDLTRTALVRVRPAARGAAPALHVTVLPTP